MVILYIKNNLFNRSAARATLLFPLSFSRHVKNEQRRNKIKQLDDKQRIRHSDVWYCLLFVCFEI